MDYVCTTYGRTLCIGNSVYFFRLQSPVTCQSPKVDVSSPVFGTSFSCVVPAMFELDGEAAPAISETVTMLYYKDITAAAVLCGETLGLEKSFHQNSVKLFRLTPSSGVAIIREGSASYHRVRKKPGDAKYSGPACVVR
jgi:hypothetical protein